MTKKAGEIGTLAQYGRANRAKDVSLTGEH